LSIIQKFRKIDDMQQLSIHTKNGYNHNVKQFLEFTKIKSSDELLSTDSKELQTLLYDYTDYLNDLVNKKLLSPNTVPKKFKGIKSLLDGNERENDIKWKALSSRFPRKVRKSGYKPYLTSHIQEMLEHNKSIRAHAFVHFMASSGGRIGVHEHPLLMKHLIPMTWEKENDCYAILLYADSDETIAEKDQRILLEEDKGDYSYFGFLIPEATTALHKYFSQREREGEHLTPDTPIFRTVYQIKQINDNVKQLSRKGAIELMKRIFNNTSIQRIKTGTRYDIQIDHGYRKRFNTILKLKNEVNSNIAEKLMSHKRGLDGTYLTPTRKECFNEFCKAIFELTVSSAQRDQVKIVHLEKKADRVERLNRKMDELEIQNEGMLNFIEGLQRKGII